MTPPRPPTHTVLPSSPLPPPLQVRFLHDPSKAHGFVGALLSSNIIHFTKVGGRADAILPLGLAAGGSILPAPEILTRLCLCL